MSSILQMQHHSMIGRMHVSIILHIIYFSFMSARKHLDASINLARSGDERGEMRSSFQLRIKQHPEAEDFSYAQYLGNMMLKVNLILN